MGDKVNFLFAVFLAFTLRAQTPVPTGAGGAPPKQSCDATDWQKRAEWAEAKTAATEAKMNAMAQFYAAQEQLTGLAAKEPPKPKEEKK